MAAEPAAVETQHLVKRFGATLAVDDLTLTVEPGVVHGLLGRNGAGKTTLLRILFGLLHPDSGAVRLFGRDAPPEDVSARDGVAGFVEEPRFYPYLSARRNLELLARLDGRPGATRVDEALELVGLAGRARHRVGNFSTGMRQRLGLAASLLREPRLLLLDEPTIGLDPAGARGVVTMIRDLAARGVTVLLSSHNMSEVDEVCDTVLIVADGRAVWEGTLERLRATAPAPVYRLATSDDERALELARAAGGPEASRAAGGRGLSIRGDDATRDALAVALGRAGIAVRLLEPEVPPLEALFAALTQDDAGVTEPERSREGTGVEPR